jgi:serine/threonine protein kinase
LPTAIARFYREMEAIGKLHHPNIVQAFDAGEVNGQSYIGQWTAFAGHFFVCIRGTLDDMLYWYKKIVFRLFLPY